MGLKNDKWIQTNALNAEMITPFVNRQVRIVDGNKVISYGCSSYGYDVRLAPEFKLAKMLEYGVLDPKNMNVSIWEQVVTSDSADTFVIPPYGFVLTSTIEYFKVPADVLCLVIGKSTYARLGLIVNATPLEPSWEGNITLELTNSTPLPIKIYANEGIAQVIFFTGDEEALETYASRNGKYQGQRGIVMSKV